jgi:endonuclease YncB( thermonuclease family)
MMHFLNRSNFRWDLKQSSWLRLVILSVFGGIAGIFFFYQISVAKEFSPLALRGYQNVKVSEVYSVDTLILENGVKIRLIGIKSLPKPSRKKVEVDEFGFVVEEISPESPIEDQAFEFVRSLLNGELVDVEFDQQRNDENFYDYGYVFLSKDKTFVNAEILRQGYAFLQLQQPNMKYADILRAAYQEARQELRGLHGQ